jgi:hypothetical protein
MSIARVHDLAAPEALHRTPSRRLPGGEHMAEQDGFPTGIDVVKIAVFAALESMTHQERMRQDPRAVATWLFSSAGDGLAETRALLTPERAALLEPGLSVVETYQELGRRIYYLARVRGKDRAFDWDTRLSWDVIAACSRDLQETARAVTTLATHGLDAPAKVLLRHAMEVYARMLVVLRDPEERRAYLRALRLLREAGTSDAEETAYEEYRSIGAIGGQLMDRLALIEENLDLTTLPSRERAEQTATILRDVYAYFSNLTHGGPSMVDEVLYVYDETVPSHQRRRVWSYGEMTEDGRLVFTYLTLLLWQAWRMVPEAMLRSGLVEMQMADSAIVVAASRALERAVVSTFAANVFPQQ